MEQVKSKCVATFRYIGPDGALKYVCKRWEPGRNGRSKDFSYSQPQAGGTGWINNLDGVEKIPYNLPVVMDHAKRAHPVFVVEGEGKVDAMAKLGFVATCNPCGAEKWLPSFGKYLEGRRVVILPDNDEPGWRHAMQVAGSLICWAAAAIWVIHLPGLPDGGDVVDWILAQTAEGKDARRELTELVKAAPKWERK